MFAIFKFYNNSIFNDAEFQFYYILFFNDAIFQFCPAHSKICLPLISCGMVSTNGCYARGLGSGWGTNNENINIDDRKWLTSTTFLSPRNINIEKVRRRYSSFFWGGPGPLSMLFFVPFKNEKKKTGITSNVITYDGLRCWHKKEIFSRNNVDNISRLKMVT